MLILLYKGVSPISLLIRMRARWLMWLGDMADRSHAAIVPGDGWRDYADHRDMSTYLSRCTMYEAWHRASADAPAGVARRCGISAAHTPNTRVDVYAVDQAFVDIGAVRRFLDAQVGLPYDFRGVMGFISRRDRAQAKGKWFCSEYATAACIEGGLPLLARLPPHRTHPGVLTLSPHMDYLGYALTGKWPIFVDANPIAKMASRIACSASRPLAAPCPAQDGQIDLQGVAARMQGHSAVYPAVCVADRLAAANSAPASDLSAANQSVLTSASFVVVQDGLFIPFGDYPQIAHDARGREVPVIQRWDSAAANAVIADLAATAAGKPVYRGHPDVPSLAVEWPDKDAKGWIHSANIATHDGRPGVVFAPKYNSDGVDIVTNAKLKFPSPYFSLSPTGASIDGARIVMPATLISMGLVNNPNIPVPAVANAAPSQPGGEPATPQEDAMREQLIAMLTAAGIAVPEGATDEQLVELVKTGMTAAANTAEQAEAARVEADRAKSEAEAKAKAEGVAAANARQLAAGAIVDLAIVQGRVTKAKRADWLGQFNANFAAANSAIAALDPVLPVGPGRTGALGARNAALQDQGLAAANARMEFRGLVEVEEGRLRSTMQSATPGRVREIAWANVQRQHKEVFDRAYAAAK